MKIAFDVTPLSDGNNKRGAGIYTEKLKEELEKRKDITLIPFKKKNSIPNADLIHYPYFDPFFLTLPLIKKIPTVVTVHDMIPLVFPNGFKKGFKGEVKWQIQKYSLKKAHRIITDSASSKKDIEKIVGVDRNKIDVIYLAPSIKVNKINNSEKEIIKKKYLLPQKFLLYVGDINYNKNIPNLYRAFSYIKNKIPLVLVGSSFLNNNLKEKKELDYLEKKLNIEDYLIKIGRVEDIELPYIYSLAFAYIQPSLYEGFGLPVVDAMLSGCPVIVSKTSSLNEISARNAVFVNPNQPEDISSGIDKLISYNKEELKRMIDEGKKEVEKFSWKKTADETIQSYKNALTKT